MSAAPAASNSRHLVLAHLDAMFLRDARGRLVAVNQFDGGPVPRLYLAQDGKQQMCCVRADVPEAMAAELKTLAADERLGQSPWPALDERYRAVLARHAPVERTSAGPTYHASRPLTVPSGVVAIDAGNAHLLEAAMPDWLPDVPHRWPFMAAVEDGMAVAVCASARISSAAHEAGVETVPAYRERGLARRVVAAWIAAVQCVGALPLYSTSWENVGSQRLAASLGLEAYGAEYHLG